MSIALYLSEAANAGRSLHKEEKASTTPAPSQTSWDTDSEDDSFIASEEETAREVISKTFSRLKRNLDQADLEEGKPPRKKAKLNPIFSKEIIDNFSRGDFQPIIGRENEIKEIMAKMQAGLRPVLTSPTGWGKNALMRAVSLKLNEAGTTVMVIRCVLLAAEILNKRARNANSDYRKDVEIVLKNNPNTLFYFENLDYLLADDNSRIYFEALARQPVQLAASISGQKNLSMLEDLKRFKFEPYPLKELPEEAQIQWIKRKCEQKITKPIEAEVYLNAFKWTKKFFKNEATPPKAFQLIHETVCLVGGDAKITSMEFAKVLSAQVAIRPEELIANDYDFLENMEKVLNAKILFQEQPIKKVCNVIRSAKLGLTPERGPRAVMMLIGSSGVGKTEMVKTVAETMKLPFIRIDMSEFRDKESISGLIGARPGLVGYKAGGFLTNAVKKNPAAVILIDEIEEADEAVRHLFLQLFDEGRLSDAKNTEMVDFSKTFIFMTTNIGGAQVYQEGKKADLEISSKVQQALAGEFEDKFLNRIRQLIPFNPIGEEDKSAIYACLMKKLINQDITLSWDPAVMQFLSDLKCNLNLGVRELERHFMTHIIDGALTQETIKRRASLRGPIHLSMQGSKVIASTKGKKILKNKLK